MCLERYHRTAAWESPEGKLGFVNNLTSKRLAELKEEMAQLRDEDRKYWDSRGRYHPAAIVAHEDRMDRMKEILEEIAKLKR